MDKLRLFWAGVVGKMPSFVKPPYSGKQVIFFLLVILLLAGAGAAGVYSKFQPIRTIKIADHLVVDSAYPQGGDVSQHSFLRLNFNFPVEAHHLPDFSEITPPIKGQWVKGETPSQVMFQPDDVLPLGVSYTVVIKSGLTSTTGKKLLEDYKYYFKVTGRSDIISFSRGDDNEGKFMAFPQSEGATLTLKVGTEIQKPKVKIYKAKSEDLIQSLAYRTKTDEYTTSDYPKSGMFIDNVVDTSKLLPVKVYDQVETGQVISLKENTGLYLLQGFDGERNVSNAWVSLNESVIHFRQDDQKVVLGVQDIATNVPASGYQATFVTLQESSKVVGDYSLSNIQEYPYDGTKRLDLIVAQKGNDILVVPVGVPNSQANVQPLSDLNKDKQLFLYTDRPIYKKGDTVFYRGLVRIDNDGLYKNPPAGTKVSVYINDYSSGKTEKKLNQTVTLNEGGVFAGQFKLTDEFTEGSIYLYASTNLDKDVYTEQTTANFDIAEYIKPDFDLSVEMEKAEYVKGDKVKATITGSYFNGKPFANQQVNYQFYKKAYYETEKAAYNKSFNLNGWGGMCGGGGGYDYYGENVGNETMVTLDSQGKAVVELDTTKLDDNLSQEITLVAFKDNQNYSSATPSNDPYSPNKNQIVGAKNVIVHNGEFNLFFLPGTNKVTAGDPFSFGFYAETENGQKIANTEFEYAVVQSDYNSGSSKYVEQYLKSGKVQTNGEGIGQINDSYTPTQTNTSYSIEVFKKDSRGNRIANQKYVYFVDKESQKNAYPYANESTILKITAAKANLIVGTLSSLDIEAPTDMNVLVSFDRGRVYKPQWLNLKKGKNTFTFSVEDTFAPSISPTFSFIYQGRYYIEGLSLNVPALHKLLTVTISTDKLQYAPGETALVTVETQDASNNLISADISIGIVDKAIYALRKNSTPPIHSSFYFFRARATNDSSSLTSIGMYGDGAGGRGGGGGGSLFNKDVDTLYWNEKLRTGTDGRVTVSVPVGTMQTTWKILSYASTEDTKVGQGDFDMLVAK